MGGSGAEMVIVYVLVTFDEGSEPNVRDYESRETAMEVYRMAVRIRDHAYLYEIDDSGGCNLILELD